MSSHSQDVIAWLIPTAHNSWADKATTLPENTSRTILSTNFTPFLSSRLPNLSFPASRPQRAIQLSFDEPPKCPGSFIIGTDAQTCDIVLPAIPGISAQHCELSFDAESRLVLNDFSERGTQVWYDWESSGDQTDYSWILSSACSRDFPSTVQRITIDIQGVRFQVVVNDHSADWDAYLAKVDSFCEQLDWEDEDAPWLDSSVSPMAHLLPSAPLFQHIVVKSLGSEPTGEVYLWNLARPWEPMVKASA